MNNKIEGCLLGGALGDALGYAVEFSSLAKIHMQYGAGGIRELPQNGHVSDDTQMTLFTAVALLHGVDISNLWRQYQRWLYTQNGRCAEGVLPPSEQETRHEIPYLMDVKELYASRAPGTTCLSALDSGELGTMSHPLNNSKGCGGVMRTAPCGFVSQSEPFLLGMEAAALTHGHPSGYISAGMLSHMVSLLLTGEGILSAAESAIRRAEKEPQHEECTQAAQNAIAFAASDMPSENAIARMGEGWVGEEALAIALYCALKERDCKEALILAVNHEGDSDSTGAICGNILGAAYGTEALPQDWVERVELLETIRAIAACFD